MVRLVDVMWDVVGFSVGQVRAVRKVKGDVKEIHDFFVGFNCDLKVVCTSKNALFQQPFLQNSTNAPLN